MTDQRAQPEALAKAWASAFGGVAGGREQAQKALEAAPAGSLDAAWAFWLLALADARTGATDAARARLQPTRLLFVQQDCARGQAMCDELEALLCLQAGAVVRARAIHDGIDGADDPGYLPLDRYLAHDTRGRAARAADDPEWALTHFHEALTAAEESGVAGAHAAALDRLGAMHLALFDLEDARLHCEQALNIARAAGVRGVVTSAAANLIVIHHAAARPAQALEMASFLLDHPTLQAPGAVSGAAVALALAFYANGDLERAETWLEGGTPGTGTDAPTAIDAEGTAFWAWLNTRCLLQRAEPTLARDLAVRTLAVQTRQGLPYHEMKLRQAAADACEAVGDFPAALYHLRQAQALYEKLVDQGLRVRNRALQAAHEAARVARELEQARRSRAEAESDRQRLADLNRALEAEVAQNAQLQARLREQVLRDPLTGLHNRRYLFETAPGLLELARQQRQPMSVVLIDLDRFKVLNDTHGHAAGDLVLQRMAATLAGQLRRQDIACRYGGEEFVVVMPDADGDEATRTVQALLRAFAQEPLEYRGQPLPTPSFSAGVASLPTHGDRLEQLLARADKALYRAKEAGRARVEPALVTTFASLP